MTLMEARYASMPLMRPIIHFFLSMAIIYFIVGWQIDHHHCLMRMQLIWYRHIVTVNKQLKYRNARR
jgi:hypothetical protein